MTRLSPQHVRDAFASIGAEPSRDWPDAAAALYSHATTKGKGKRGWQGRVRRLKAPSTLEIAETLGLSLAYALGFWCGWSGEKAWDAPGEEFRAGKEDGMRCAAELLGRGAPT